MTDRLELPRRYRDQLEALLREHVPGVEVWAYGSRVNGVSHEGSDLDLVLRGPALEPLDGGFHDLLEAIERSSIPILIRAHDWAMLPESFHREIERDYVVLQEETKKRSAAACEWPEVPLVQLLTEPVRNGIYKKREFHGRGVKIVNMGELFAHSRLSDIPMKRVDLTESEQQRFSVQAGDLLFARRSLVAEGAGKCSVVLEASEPTAFESSIIRARPDPRMADSSFLYYYFSSPSGLHSLDTIRRQVAVAGITGTDLAQLPIVIPPLPEQRAIAHVLGTLDDKIELNQRMNETLEEMARALFKSWFVDFEPVRAKMEGRWRDGESLPGLPAEYYDLFPDRLVDSELGDVPEGWKVLALECVIKLNHREPLKKGTSAPYLDMVALPISGPNPDEAIWRAFTSGTRFRNGDTLLARITPCLENGKTAFVQSLPEETVGWGSTEFIVMRAIPPVPPEYTYILARDTAFREHAMQSMTGTSGRQRVQMDALAAYSLPCPPAEVHAAFGLLVGNAFASIDANQRQVSSLTAQRDALLPKLVSGEVRVGETVGWK